MAGTLLVKSHFNTEKEGGLLVKQKGQANSWSFTKAIVSAFSHPKGNVVSYSLEQIQTTGDGYGKTYKESGTYYA